MLPNSGLMDFFSKIEYFSPIPEINISPWKIRDLICSRSKHHVRRDDVGDVGDASRGDVKNNQ